MLKICLCLALTLSAVLIGPRAETQPASLTISGQYGPALQLSAGTAGGVTGAVANSSTNATVTSAAPDSTNFTSSIDFGDLSKGDGEPVAAAIALRLRSNTSFGVTASVVSFQASQLRWRGQEISAADGGSFVRMWVGQLSTTGPNAASGSNLNVNGQLQSGIQMSTLTRGPATAQSTPVVGGSAASLGGSIQSPNNAVEIPVYVSVPSGYELGPSEGSAQGTFSFIVQFGMFAGA